MRTAAQCIEMAIRMDGNAARDPTPVIRAEWLGMAIYWRDLARQAAWQDDYVAGRP